jgi:hypothetical protein
MASSDSDHHDLDAQSAQTSDPHPQLADEHTHGRRIEYIITGICGALADVQAAHDQTDRRKLPVLLLARQLNLDTGSLSGRRFSEFVEPDEHGATHSGCQLIPED